jgi:metallophosphoesterase superfamily enzyme
MKPSVSVRSPSAIGRAVWPAKSPAICIAQRGRAVSRRCFAADSERLVMPAFGAFTGGLNVRDAAFADIFGTLAFTAHLLGEDRLYAFTAKRCLPD